ncbi:MAG: outer membrane lipoprotein chaperone LolA [Arsenophonus sp.]
MKKLMILWLLGISFHISQVSSNAAVELQVRLNKIHSFYANFSQKVMKVNGDLIQKGEGQLWIKHPNLFRFHMVSPDENWLISDGSNFWFYNPLLEQVTVSLLNKITTDTPFMLITRNNPKDWKHYQISQNGNDFLMTTTQKNMGNLKKFSITIQSDGTIQEFASIEKNGQIILYELKSQKNDHVDDNKFKFFPPPGVTIDDQRSIR